MVWKCLRKNFFQKDLIKTYLNLYLVNEKHHVMIRRLVNLKFVGNPLAVKNRNLTDYYEY